jgi:hypothetical protein
MIMAKVITALVEYVTQPKGNMANGMQKSQRWRAMRSCVTRYHRRKNIKIDAISSGLSHWGLEGKNWLRSDEQKASNLGKKEGASLLISSDTISCFWYNG